MVRGKLHWRRGTGGYHYYEDDKWGWAHVFRTISPDGSWYASTYHAGRTFKLLKDAKRWVERQVKRGRRA